MTLLTCPDCGYTYPPGSLATADGVLDAVVESGGRSTHPAHCPRSEAPREPSLGMFQQQPYAWTPTHDSTEYVSNAQELDALPNMSVVQFRGSGLRGKTRLVYQFDESNWYAPGDTEAMPSDYFPPEAYPAAVIWKPISAPENHPHRPAPSPQHPGTPRTP